MSYPTTFLKLLRVTDSTTSLTYVGETFNVTALVSSIGTSTFTEFFSRVASLAPLVARRFLWAGTLAWARPAAATGLTAATGVVGATTGVTGATTGVARATGLAAAVATGVTGATTGVTGATGATGVPLTWTLLWFFGFLECLWCFLWWCFLWLCSTSTRFCSSIYWFSSAICSATMFWTWDWIMLWISLSANDSAPSADKDCDTDSANPAICWSTWDVANWLILVASTPYY